VVALVGAAYAATERGLYWENRTTGAGEKVRTAQIYAQPKMMKIVNGGGGTILIRGDQEKLYRIDPKNKTYMVFTLAQIEATAKAVHGQMEAAMEKLQKQAKLLPPDKRAKMEKMMKDLAGSADDDISVTVKNTGESKSISGYTCTKYVATSKGKTVLTAWATKDVPGFERLRDDWLVYQKRLMASSPGAAADVIAAYAKIEGFPMETDIGNVKTVVTKVEPRTLSPAEFEVPAGYVEEKLGRSSAHGQ